MSNETTTGAQPPAPEALLRVLKSIKGDVTTARACLQDSVETHGTQGGWLDEECQRLSRVEDEIDAALSSQETGKHQSE